jgi:hypothetical protein
MMSDKRVTEPSKAYKELMHSVECRIVELGKTHEWVDDAAG